MYVVRVRNVREALSNVPNVINAVCTTQASRNGPVMASYMPVTTVYESPTERWLADDNVRNANPFFHLFEAIWMMAGRDDATWLDRFVSDFSERYAEGSGRMWGAYGKRWRGNWECDQLTAVVARLRRDPSDRRCVISMWDPDLDIWDPEDINEDTGQPFDEPRDLPCNTHMYPRVNEGSLDLTVCCRSNDAIWGAYGANAVHFSFLQEWLAAAIGVGVGTMYQVSNNWHVYENTRHMVPNGPVRVYEGEPVPICEHHPDKFLSDCERFCETPDLCVPGTYRNPWFYSVAYPALMAHAHFQNRDHVKAHAAASSIADPALRLACVGWLRRRIR